MTDRQAKNYSLAHIKLHGVADAAGMYLDHIALPSAHKTFVSLLAEIEAWLLANGFPTKEVQCWVDTMLKLNAQPRATEP